MRVGAWERVPFLEAVSDESRGHTKVKQSDYLSEGALAVVDQGQELVGGFTDVEHAASRVQLPAIIFGDHTRAMKFIDFPFAVGADGVKVLKARPGVDSRYLYRYLQTVQLTDGGYSRHFKYLKEIDVPLPPIEEQRRIAAVLDAADDLRTRRREALAKLDTLTQAIFIDMFGDPAANPQQWPRRPLREVSVKFSDGPFGSNLKSDHYQDSGIRVVRLQNIGTGHFVNEVAAYISEDHFATLSKHECRPGDVLVATLGDPNLRACIQPDWLDVALNKADCVQIRVDERVATGEWLCAVLNHASTEEMAQSLVRGQTRTRISMGRLRDLEVPVPPLELLAQFSRLRQTASVQLRLLQTSQFELDDLFASLQQRAFRGEL
jgi:type I restriction enzyme S subunit